MRLLPERTTRIFPGADLAFVPQPGTRSYASGKQLLFAGTWRKNKGIEDLVPAFVDLANRWPDLRLAVLGPGVRAGVVLEAFPETVRPRVDVRFARNDSETAAQFLTADLFVLPSLFEGTPLTLLEAMMSGLPIVTTAVCGMRDVIRNGQNGLLVPIRDPRAIAAAVGKLLQDESLRARLGRNAGAEAQACYTWDRVAEPVRQVYEQLRYPHEHRRNDAIPTGVRTVACST
jgi:glycosyltransferase involved in cell wall biosynthesis